MSLRHLVFVVLAVVLAATGMTPIADAQRGEEPRGKTERPGWNDIFTDDSAPARPVEKPEPNETPPNVGPVKTTEGEATPVATDGGNATGGDVCGTLPDPADIGGPVVVDEADVAVLSNNGRGTNKGPLQSAADVQPVAIAGTGSEWTAAMIAEFAVEPMVTLSQVQLPVGALYRYRYVAITDQVTELPPVVATDSYGFTGDDFDPANPPPVTVQDLGDVDEERSSRAHMRVEAAADVVVLSDLADDQGAFDGQWLLVTVQGACGATWTESDVALVGTATDALSLDMPIGPPANEEDLSIEYAGSFEMRRDRTGRVVEVLHEIDTDPVAQMFREGLASSFSVDVASGAAGASVPETDRTTTQTSDYSATTAPEQTVVLRTAQIPLEGLVRAATFDLRAEGVVGRSELRDELTVAATKPGFYDLVSRDDGTTAVPDPATLPPGVSAGDAVVDGSAPPMDHYGSPVGGAVLNEAHLWLEAVAVAPPALVQSGLAAVSAGGVSNALTPTVAKDQLRQIDFDLAEARFAEGLDLMAAADAAGEQTAQRALPTVLDLLVTALSADETLLASAAAQVTSQSLSPVQSESVLAAIATVDTPAAHAALESVLLSSADLPASVEMTAIANTLVLRSPATSLVNAVVARNAGPVGDTANLVAASLARDSGDAALVDKVEAELMKSLDDPERATATVDGLKALATRSARLAAVGKRMEMAENRPLDTLEKKAGEWFGPAFRVVGSSGKPGSGPVGDIGDIGMTMDPVLADPEICIEAGVVCTSNWQVLCVGYLLVDGFIFDDWPLLPPAEPAWDVCMEWIEVAPSVYDEELVDFDEVLDDGNLYPLCAQEGYICTTFEQYQCVFAMVAIEDYGALNCDDLLGISGPVNSGPGTGTDVPEGAFQWEETLGNENIYGKFWLRADPSDKSRLATYKAEAGAAVFTPHKVLPIVFATAVMKMNTEDDNAQNDIVLGPPDDPAMHIGQVSREVDFRAYLFGKQIWADTIEWECGMGASGQLFDTIRVGGPTDPNASAATDGLESTLPVLGLVRVKFSASIGLTLSGDWAWSLDACGFPVGNAVATAAGELKVYGSIEVTAEGALDAYAIEAGIRLQVTVFSVQTPFKASAQLVHDVAEGRVTVEPCYSFELEIDGFYGTVSAFVRVYLKFFDKRVNVWSWSGQLFDFDLGDKIKLFNDDGFEVFASECQAVTPVTPVFVTSSGAGSSQNGSVFTNPMRGEGAAARPLGATTLSWAADSFSSALEITGAAFCHEQGYAVPGIAPVTANDFALLDPAASAFWMGTSYSSSDPDSATFDTMLVSNNTSAERIKTLTCGAELDTGTNPTISATIQSSSSGGSGGLVDGGGISGKMAQTDGGSADSSAGTQLLTIGEEYYVEFTVTNPDLVNDVVVDTVYVDNTPVSGCDTVVPANSSAVLPCQVPIVPTATDSALMSRTVSLGINGDSATTSTTSWFYTVDVDNAPVDIVTSIGINQYAGGLWQSTATAPGPVLHPNPTNDPQVLISINGGLTELSNVQAMAPFGGLSCTPTATPPTPNWSCLGSVAGLTASAADQDAVFTALDQDGVAVTWQKPWFATTPQVSASASVKVDNTWANGYPGPAIDGTTATVEATITTTANLDVAAQTAEVVIAGSTTTMACTGNGSTRICTATIAKSSLPVDEYVTGTIQITTTTAFESHAHSTNFYINNIETLEVETQVTITSDGTTYDASVAPGALLLGTVNVIIDIESNKDLYSVTPTGPFSDLSCVLVGGGVAGGSWQCSGDVYGLAADVMPVESFFATTSSSGIFPSSFSVPWFGEDAVEATFQAVVNGDEADASPGPLVDNGSVLILIAADVESNIDVSSLLSMTLRLSPGADDLPLENANAPYGSCAPTAAQPSMDFTFFTDVDCFIIVPMADVPKDQIVVGQATVFMGTEVVGTADVFFDMRNEIPPELFDVDADIAQSYSETIATLDSFIAPSALPSVSDCSIEDCVTYKTTTIFDSVGGIAKDGDLSDPPGPIPMIVRQTAAADLTEIAALATTDADDYHASIDALIADGSLESVAFAWHLWPPYAQTGLERFGFMQDVLQAANSNTALAPLLASDAVAFDNNSPLEAEVHVGSGTFETIRFDGDIYHGERVVPAHKVTLGLEGPEFYWESAASLESLMSHEGLHVDQAACAVQLFGEGSFIVTDGDLTAHSDWLDVNIEVAAYFLQKELPRFSLLSDDLRGEVSDKLIDFGANPAGSGFIITAHPDELLVLEHDGNGGYGPIRPVTTIEANEWLRATC